MNDWLILNNISLSYRDTRVIEQLELQVGQSEHLAILGASGCGKSTILKAIAGLIPVRAGEIWLNGQCLSSTREHIRPQNRQIGMIFQDYALFPHLTADENIAFGLQHLSARDRKQRTQKYLELVQLSAFAKRYPHELSGGQQQRIAIARTLAREPKLLLLDEPFSNLDNVVKHSLIDDIRTILAREHITAIFVTHHKTEAFALAEQIAIIDKGKIIQKAAPQTLYDHPCNAEIAHTLGNSSRIPLSKQGNIWQSPLGNLPDPLPKQYIIATQQDEYAEILLRPHQLHISPNENGNARIIATQFLGDYTRYTLQISGHTLIIESPYRYDPSSNLQIEWQKEQPNPIHKNPLDENVILANS